MNKYQKAYELECEREHIIDLILDKYPEVQEEIYNNEKYKENIKKMKSFEKKYGHLPSVVLGELVNQTKPRTLEEVQKKWEAKGYIWKETEFDIKIISTVPTYLLKIRIFKNTKTFQGIINFQEYKLIKKTIEALEWL